MTYGSVTKYVSGDAFMLTHVLPITTIASDKITFPIAGTVVAHTSSLLTPALSLGEREKDLPPPGQSRPVGQPEGRDRLSPLPGGEYVFSVVAGILPAVEPGILPGGRDAWCENSIR